MNTGVSKSWKKQSTENYLYAPKWNSNYGNNTGKLEI